MNKLMIFGFSILDDYRVLRTSAQAVAQAVAKVLCQQAGLAVNDANRALGAARHAHTAAIALAFVNLHNLSRSYAVHRCPFR